MESVNDGINIACAAPHPYQGWVSVCIQAPKTRALHALKKVDAPVDSAHPAMEIIVF
ncbi:hypothetical protein APV28_4427 [Comamonas testosteroni]|nr:hypothetical protein APV28_4427 [Comamonas testosteroni]